MHVVRDLHLSRWRTVIAAWCLACSLLIAQTAQACRPPSPDPWFNITVTLDRTHVPSEIVLEVPSGHMTHQSIAFRNPTDVPLYVLRLKTSKDPEGNPQNLPIPPNTIADARITAQEAAQWRKGTWQLARSTGIVRSVYDYSYFPGLENKNIISFDRPEQPAIPLSQQSQFILLYGDQLITVPLTLTYSLNPHYRVSQEMPPCPYEDDMQMLAVMMALHYTVTGIIACIVVFFVGLYVKSWFQRDN